MSSADDIPVLVAGRPVVEILRQLHRWIAVVLALFLLVIAATGTMLQVIMVVYGDPGPARFNRLPHALGLFRVWVFNIHTLFFGGVASSYYGMACGMGLLFFSVSGIWMYVRLYRNRAALGRGGLFWGTRTGPGAGMRSLHRWLTLGIVLFTAVLGFTGASLDFDTARNHDLLYDTPLPGTPARLVHPGNGPPPFWHDVNFQLHKLDYFGMPGHVLGVFTGLGLVMLTASGAWMYFALYGRRARAGRRQLFW